MADLLSVIVGGALALSEGCPSKWSDALHGMRAPKVVRGPERAYASPPREIERRTFDATGGPLSGATLLLRRRGHDR